LSRFEREIAELAELAKRRVASAAPPAQERAGDEVPAGVGEEST
jgi:hypothetical protein